ncbi:MAG: ABC transporter ATP-binding protein [Acidobacteria bacterium]|nr:ABC transporter ATP-binding protein [Acidobacteriota bacterium]
MLTVQNVSKMYRLYRRPADRIVEAVSLNRVARHTDFWALQDINQTVARGETLGIVGPNGSGKSTLLGIICGVLEPTRGRVVRQGRVAALLELGAGFNPEFTGRENVYLNGEILGLSRAEVERAMPEIERFAEIGEFLDRPVKTYSSGMYVRLAFSTAINVSPDILAVDEALAVGDAVFANRCVRKFEEIKRRGVTVVFVSHDLSLVKLISDRAIFLLNGRIAAEGEPSDVINRYNGMVLERQKAFAATELELPAGVRPRYRHGDRLAEVSGVELLGRDSRATRVVESGEAVTVRVTARFHADEADPILGIMIRTRIGMDVYGTNTLLEKLPLGPCRAGEAIEVDFQFECWLSPQEYTLTVATQHPDGSSHDWLDEALAFTVVASRFTAGVANLRARTAVRRVERVTT